MGKDKRGGEREGGGGRTLRDRFNTDDQVDGGTDVGKAAEELDVIFCVSGDLYGLWSLWMSPWPTEEAAGQKHPYLVY